MTDHRPQSDSSYRTLADRVASLFASFGAKGAKIVEFPTRSVERAAIAASPESPRGNVSVLPEVRARAVRGAAPASERVRHEPAASLDAATVRELEKLGGTPGFAMTALAIFADDCAILLGEIERALKERRFQAVRDAAQALKGNASCVGAVAMMAASTRVIRADIAMLRRDGDKLLRELRHAFDRVASDIDVLRGSTHREQA